MVVGTTGDSVLMLVAVMLLERDLHVNLSSDQGIWGCCLGRVLALSLGSCQVS